MYAVIKTGGKQYRVAAGDKIKVEHLPSDVGDVLTIDHVLAISKGEQSLIGEPTVSGASVSATVIEQGRHDKVRIFKLRRRKHYRKTQGHRQSYTELFVSKIESSLGADSADAKEALDRAQRLRDTAAIAAAGGAAASAAGKAADRSSGGKSAAADKPKAEKKSADKPADNKADVETKTDDAAATAAAAAAAKPTRAPGAAADDLTKVEGVGPKIAELLIADGVTTFAELAATPVDKIKQVLADAGSRFATHDPATWPEQAALAADGKWDELTKLQDELDGGRRV